MLSKRDLLAGGSALFATAALPIHAQAAPIVVRAPIRFAPNGMPLIRLTIGGKGPYAFLIDTGAFSSLIKEPLAKTLGLSVGGQIRTGSIKGHEDSYIYEARDVIVGGGFKIPHMTFIGAANFKMDAVDGILPASILTGLPTQLDYEASEIRFYLNGAEMDLDGFLPVDAFFQADHDDAAEKVYLNLTIGKDKLLCLLDTGAAANILVASGYVDRHHWWNHFPLVREGNSRGVNGEPIKTRMVTATDIGIGGVHVDKMPITLCDPGVMETIDDFDGLVGTPLLRKFTIAFAPHKKLYFKPNTGFALVGQDLPDTLMSGPVDAAPGTAVVPFLYGEDRKVVIPGRVADKSPIAFIVETANAFSSIKSEAAATLGLAAEADGSFNGGAVEFNGGLKMPALRLKPQTGQARGDGYLGLDFLRALPSQLDFESDQLTFYTQGAPDLAGFSRLTLAPRPDGAGPGLYVLARLEGQATACRIDTGYQMGVFLPAHTVKARGLWNKYPDAENRGLSAGGGKALPARYVKMQGGLDLDDQHIAVAPVTMLHPDAPDSHNDIPVDAIIGMGVLRRFTVVLLPDGGIAVKPNRFFATG